MSQVSPTQRNSMIDVSIKYDGEKKSLSLKVKGHAKQAEIGKDIVCASASMLTYTVAQLIKDMGKKQMLTTEPVIVLKEGNATVSCQCKSEEEYIEALNYYNFVYTGCLLLAHNYPQYVQVKFVGKSE